METVREEANKARDAVTKYTEAHPDGLLAKVAGGSHNHKRRLQSLSTMNALIDLQQERMQVSQRSQEGRRLGAAGQGARMGQLGTTGDASPSPAIRGGPACWQPA